MSASLGSLALGSEHDVVTARQRARDIAGALGFDRQDQTRVATAVSEIARNAVSYARGGRVEFHVEGEAGAQHLAVHVIDEGPGIADLNRILWGRYRSKTGMGQGIVGARRLMDRFEIESSAAGTSVWLRKSVPRKANALSAPKLAKIAGEFASQSPRNVLDELRHENQELLQALDEVRKRQEELNRLNTELEETNRGVVALYAELDERAEHLRLADQAKSRFLSYMSHEFRTPLTSIMALARLLLDEADGPLSSEQQKQVSFIRKSAEALLDIVNDLLDLTKVEAGKTEVRPSQVRIGALFGTLRGMMKPLLTNDQVSLIFEDASDLPPLFTDEAKLAQILRNFVSNALKFTERGEVRVSARLSEAGDAVVFAVSDTGIGIPPEQHDRIFQEFAQLDSALQKNVKGTGLGLALAKKLAELLGGGIAVESRLGAGATFFATVPLVYPAQTGPVDLSSKLLVIDDEEVSRYLLRQSLGLPAPLVLEAASGEDGLAQAQRELPRAIFLDLRMAGMNGFDVLKRLKAERATAGIPVIIVTSKHLSAEERSSLEEHAAAILSKDILTRQNAGKEIRAALARAGVSLEALAEEEPAAVHRK